MDDAQAEAVQLVRKSLHHVRPDELNLQEENNKNVETNFIDQFCTRQISA